MGFDRNQLIESLRNRTQNKATVAYYLLLDNRFRGTSGYLGAEFQESMVISEIIETCRAHDFTDLVLVHEHRGQPDGLIVCHLPFGPTAYFGLHNVVTRHDIKDKKYV